MNTMPNDGNPIYLSVNLRVLRKMQGWSQEEFAEKVGLNRGNIASYEKGSAEPKICNLLKFAKIFRVSIIDLTKKDLSQIPLPKVVEEITSPEDTKEGRAVLKKFQEEMQDIELFVNGVYNCHCYRVKNCEELSPNLQKVADNMDELYQVTQKLLQQHKDLLNYLECKK